MPRPKRAAAKPKSRKLEVIEEDTSHELQSGQNNLGESQTIDWEEGYQAQPDPEYEAKEQELAAMLASANSEPSEEPEEGKTEESEAVEAPKKLDTPIPVIALGFGLWVLVQWLKNR